MKSDGMYILTNVFPRNSTSFNGAKTVSIENGLETLANCARVKNIVVNIGEWCDADKN